MLLQKLWQELSLNRKKRRMKKKMFYNRVSVLSLCLIVLTALTGCDYMKNTSNYQNTGFAMGTVIAQNMYGGGEETAEQILGVVNKLEKTISWRIDGTEVFLINQNAGTEEPIVVNEKLAEWLHACKDVYEKSDGALDVTVGPVARLWDIGGENPRIPDEQELKEAFGKIGADNLQVDGNEVIFDVEDGGLDLGAVGKGIACDEILSFLKENAPDISGTFSVGGSVLIYGEKPTGQPWRVGIRNPLGEEGEYMGAVNIAQKQGEQMCVSTSGDYEKYFEQDGVRYHHILDPKTGAPARSDLISVTIISESGFLSDALSTACFVAGREKGLEIADVFGAEVIMITRDKEVVMTDGSEEYFELLDKEFEVKNEEK